jgi:putative hydrolase of the HAD superfamily
MQGFRDQFWGGDRLDEALVDYIRDLHRSYKTGLLSNAFSNLRSYIADVWQFADAFDEMIISAEVGMVKPDAHIYHLALECLRVEPESTVFVDDFLHNVEAARSLGMHGVRFQNPIQARMEVEQILNSK